jgi:Ser/Thr protein kinase RdoA (MazF antagonist)
VTAGREGSPGDPEDGVVLVGGMDPRYAPVRVGDTVRREAGGPGDPIPGLLRHLAAVGFDGAPRYLGIDDRGREVLTYLEGDVPLPPYPAWSMTDEAIADLGRLVRRYHAAAASFEAPPDADWAADWADPTGGAGHADRTVTHNDLFPENVVFREGGVVALIDFAMAAPGRPFWDLAIAADVWCPLGDPARREQHPPDLDGIARFGILARAYGVAPIRAEELVAVVIEERAQMVGNIRAEIAAGNASWIRNWAAAGGDERAAADDAWIAAHRADLVRAAGG